MKEENQKKKEKRIKTEFRVFVTDKHGKVVRDTGTKECRSFVKQYLVGLLTDLSKQSRTCKDVNGEVFNITTSAQLAPAWWRCYGYFRGSAPAGNDNYGIQVGHDDTPPANENYRLSDKIPHGDGAGQLEYGDMTFYDVLEHEGYMKFSFARTFLNNSGATITVKEIGFAVYVHFDERYCLWLRDVLSPPVDVEHGKTLTVQYTIKTKA